MFLSTEQEPRLMPKIRCPQCEQSNLYLIDTRALYCPECAYRFALFITRDDPSAGTAR